jgi:hypothetical protein
MTAVPVTIGCAPHLPQLAVHRQNGFLCFWRKVLGSDQEPDEHMSIEKDHSTSQSLAGTVFSIAPVILAMPGSEDLILAFVCRNQFHHRFAMLGNHNGATALRYLIHYSKALSFELRGRYFLHDNPFCGSEQNNMTRFLSVKPVGLASACMKCWPPQLRSCRFDSGNHISWSWQRQREILAYCSS